MLLTMRFLWFCWELARRHNGSVTGGCRTAARNRRVGGKARSKHRFEFGWGLACDFMFDEPDGRSEAYGDVLRSPWTPFIGDGYDPCQLHVQAFAHGNAPPHLVEDE